MAIEDPEVAPAVAFAIREQLYKIAIQSVASAREFKISKKSWRAGEHALASTISSLILCVSYPIILSLSKAGGNALDLKKLFRKEWDVCEPIVDILSAEEVDALEAREEKNTR